MGADGLKARLTMPMGCQKRKSILTSEKESRRNKAMMCVDETAENIDIHSPDGMSGSGLTALQWLTFFDATS